MFQHSYALLIGVSENKAPSLALPIVEKDVATLQDLITRSDLCGYQKDNVKVLTGPNATRDYILEGLEWIKDKLSADTDANQTALIYYSGHGHREDSGESYLIPYDFRFPLRLGALPARDFAAIIDEMKPRRLVVVLDCCHAESMGVKDVAERGFKPAALTPETLGIDLLADGGEGRAILSSSRDNQLSWIRKDEKMSVFTFHLAEALMGHVGRPSEPNVLVTEVMDYVARKVPATVRAERNENQEPAFRFAGTAFPIALVLGGKGLQKGVPAPDPLTELSLHIKSNLKVQKVKGKATNVVARIDRGQIEATSEVGEVSGEFTGVKVNLPGGGD